MSWQEEWERAANEELAWTRQQPVDELLARLKHRAFGGYLVLPDVIAEKATLAQAGWPLFEVLMDDSLDYLHRYHCAEALIKLMGGAPFEPVDLSANRAERPAHLAEMAVLLEKQIGRA